MARLTLVLLLAAAIPEQAEFFEKKIRPVLASECLECHGAEKQKGGLRLDYFGGWKTGGDSGAAIVPGDPAKSLLLRTIRHEEPDLEMPSKRPKLSDTVIADFEKWIADGAPDPRTEPSKETTQVPWNTLLADRKNWWSLQPIHAAAVPSVKDAEWSAHPVDRFLRAKMEAAGLAPGPDADARAFCRRATFIITGMPPSPEEIETFAREHAAEMQAAGRATKVTERLVDRLLASPRFGERWARHWLDLVRYAETHGSEGDPEIPHAWRYRDYVIRAFNDDVSWDQLIREHLAGDLLSQPRWNRTEGWNESMLGIAHLRLVEHGFQPVDARDEQVKVVESQIDVLGKAFQGMTFACARCHDHKFDAVSQRDYYALAGVFENSRPAIVTIDSPELLNRHRDEMIALKAQVKSALVNAWLEESARIPERLLGVKGRADEIAAAQKRVAEVEREIAKLDAIARGRVLARRGLAQPAGQVVPMPIARWDFASARDQISGLEGRLEGNAELVAGKLKLRGQGYLQTAPIGRQLREKTLEAWVRLATADQAGGGVFTVEDGKGAVFDAIVFAEKDPRQWVAGSDFFKRSRRLNGTPGSNGELVHLVLSCEGSGQTALYRNGTVYGQPWRIAEGEPVAFGPDARVLFGLRHTLGKGNGYFRGEIEEARLYDRALTAEEVGASYAGGTDLVAVSAEELAKALSDTERRVRSEFEEKLVSARAVLKQLAPAGKDPWSEALGLAEKDAMSPLRGWFAQPQKMEAAEVTPAPPLEFTCGPGVTRSPRGDFSVLADGNQVIGSLVPGGVASGLLTRKHGGIASTRWFRVSTDFISVRGAGRNAQVRMIVDGYPLPNGQIFPRATLDHDETRWVTIDVKYRKGARVYLEAATAPDLTRKEKDEARESWFAVETIAMHDGPPPATSVTIPKFTPEQPERARANALANATREAVLAWRDGKLTEDQRALLEFLAQKRLLPNDAESPAFKPVLAKYRELAAAVPTPRRATGVMEADYEDSPFLVRGDHHKPNGTVPRSYLEVFGRAEFPKHTSGRLQLAEALIDRRNPLTARVMVNRIWQHVFGRGMVPTPDNFGKMGELPTHPELLDYLAARFVESGWSAKAMIRMLVTTRAFQLASTPAETASAKDPENRWLTHFPLRRLEAETIRDTLLALSGKLDETMHGPPVGANAPRRSIYLNVRRTNLNAFLQTFDAPKPFTTMGRRDSTNVPGQSLTLLNDPFVIQCAEQWGANVAKLGGITSSEDRARTMFLASLGRTATAEEWKRFQEAFGSDRSGKDEKGSAAWRDLAQALFNVKEFIYLR